MRAVIYTRVSTVSQLDGASLENQYNKCRLSCELQDMEVIEHIEDAGCSGKDLNRQGIQKVISMMEKKAFDCLVVYSVSRLSRDVGNVSNLLTLMEKKGVGLVSVTENIDMSPSGKLILRVLTSVNQANRETSNLLIKASFEQMRKSRRNYCHITPYGWNKVDDAIVENPAEQKVIAQMVQMRDSGEPFYKIADFLNANSIPTKTGKNPWHWSSVRSILGKLHKFVA